MNFIVWFSDACKKLKKLCIKIVKKKFLNQNSRLMCSWWIHFFHFFFNSAVSVESIFSFLHSMFSEGMSTFQPTDLFVSSSTSQTQNSISNQPFQSVQFIIFFIISQLLQSGTQAAIQQFMILSIVSMLIQQSVFQSLSFNFEKKVFNIFFESHTQFFQIFKNMNKTFRIECLIQSESDIFVPLKKTVTQTNQKFDMNMISEHFIKHLNLPLNNLKKIGFDEFIMRTADHRNTSLKYWAKFTITIAGLSKLVWNFVSFRISITEFSIFEHYSILLRLSWLFNVNVFISIRHSKIIIKIRR